MATRLDASSPRPGTPPRPRLRRGPAAHESPALRRLAAALAAIQLGAGAVVVAAELAAADPRPWLTIVLRSAVVVVLAVFGARVAVRALRSSATLGAPGLLVAAAAALLLGFSSLRLAAAVVLVHDGIRGINWLRRARGGARVLVNVGQHPARSLVLSFGGLIAFGAFLLSLPAASTGESPAFVDALFTAVSATCVTGLTTLDTATAWTTFGQGVILVLIQLGGLGIMTISAFMTVAVGHELGLRRDALLRGAFDEPDVGEMGALVKGIVLWTLAIEAVGALLLFARFAWLMPLDRAGAFAVFHAVSAFCNAGFALFSDNLAAFAADPLVNATVGLLVVLGGLGFGVLVGIARVVIAPDRSRLPLHARLVLLASGVLVWLGALAYFALEYDRSLAELGLGSKLLAAVFQSVVARTAGFNTVDISAIEPATALVLIILMFVGASPGSTGGGIKTTTVAVIALSIRALVSETADVVVFGRRLPHTLVVRALALAGGAAGTFVAGLGALLVTETIAFLPLAFEAASALGTVGLSMGVTPQLSTSGRLVVAALMFVGRVGPLTAIAAAAARRPGARLQVPEDRVLVG